ncbi:hypothetical protein Smp_067440 [Schistosoma mansoni]|uniref:hypothetical protein n=1 Tax=Schistosoma mansoni TaxID=6183 RepID=UPI0001A62BBF|nr:hypothetical protein Smp_067440 [Schistosoma mansoni]|eukprot:XP_018646553.1 hypothetical protein Smp_067440 [Schistosoma mansoni]
MADYNRPLPIRSMPPMPRSLPLLGSRSLSSLSQHKHSTWNTQSLQVMHGYRPTVSTSIGEQIVAPVLNNQSSLPLQPILSSCWSNAERFPPTHYPPPAPFGYLSIPQQSVVNFESTFNSWLSYYEPIFIERRGQCKEQNNIQLPVYRNMLVKWSELIQKMQSTSTQNEMPSSFSLQNELNAVQQYCINPHITNLVKKKLRVIHKKRRYLKRLRERRQNSQLQSSTSSVIIQSTTGSILERLKSDILLTIEQSSVHDKQEINVDNHTDNVIDNESKQKLFNISEENNNHHHHHHHFNQMKTTLRKSIDECQKRIQLLNNLEKLRSARLAQAEQQEIPQRWERFYHQADYNFCDFIRIRYAWDKYLKMDIPTNENVLDSLTNLQLPKSWILPQMNNNHHHHNDDQNDQIDNIKEKWDKYLKPIPCCYT